jgi:hypothetical protein
MKESCDENGPPRYPRERSRPGDNRGGGDVVRETPEIYAAVVTRGTHRSGSSGRNPDERRRRREEDRPKLWSRSVDI